MGLSSRSSVLGYLTILLLTLTFVIQSSNAQGGMVPLSDVIDHKVDNKKPSQSQNQQGSELSPEKVKAHMKIATSHLKSSEDDLSDDLTKAKVSRKDKPSDLQNPSKHMAEEFVLNFLMSQYPKSTSVDEQVEILQNLENFVHKFENGRDLFKATSALESILLPALNSSHVEIRKSACGVFAIAAQNNLEVQRLAADAGVIRRMIHLLTFDQPLRSKALFALTTLLRNFPKGQHKFVQDGGIPALVKIASYSETRKRSLNFVADLLSERKYCRESRKRLRELMRSQVSVDPEELSELDDPCDDLNTLESALKESGWCDVLTDSVRNIPGFDTEDQTSTCEAVASSLVLCSETVAPYANIFHHLKGKFDEDEDFKSESDLIQSILKVVDPLSILPKDEL